VSSAEQQQQRVKQQCYQHPMRTLTGDEQKLMDALVHIGIDNVTRSAFFSLLGLPSMDGLALFTKDIIKTLCAQMRDLILKRKYEHDAVEEAQEVALKLMLKDEAATTAKDYKLPMAKKLRLVQSTRILKRPSKLFESVGGHH
jgi:hypothetical protein